MRAGNAPATVGPKDPKVRELEAIGVVASSYEPIEPRFTRFRAPMSGRYKIRFSGYSVWVGPGTEKRWWTPNLDNVSPGRRSEPVTIYSETPPRQLRLIGGFDLGTQPTVRELDTYLLEGETAPLRCRAVLPLASAGLPQPAGRARRAAGTRHAVDGSRRPDRGRVARRRAQASVR